jgi:hypothetical protein
MTEAIFKLLWAPDYTRDGRGDIQSRREHKCGTIAVHKAFSEEQL